MTADSKKCDTFRDWDDNNFEIFRNELNFIENRRKNIKDPTEADLSEKSSNKNEEENHEILSPSTEHNLAGLCLSGGGIRSATFNLGFIQALYRYNILHRVDYLSTVSGGGYIGSCLTSLLNSDIDASFKPTTDFFWKEENFPFAQPDVRSDKNLDKDQHNKTDNRFEDKISAEKAPVRHLRYFSTYLTQGDNLFYRYFSPLVVFSRGVVFNFLLILPVIIILAGLLTAIYTIPSFIGEKSPAKFLNTKELTSSLHNKKKAHDELQAFVIENTGDFKAKDFSSKLLLLQQDQEDTATFQTKKKKMEDADRVVRKHLWSIVFLPSIAFIVMLFVWKVAVSS